MLFWLEMMNKESSRKFQLNSLDKSPLHFSQINIDGLSKHSKTALDKFAFINNISLIALQETKLYEDRIDSLDEFQNHEHFILPKTQETYGVGLLISPQHYPQSILELQEANCDIIWCLIKVKDTCVLTASAYCPPNNIQKFQNLLNNISNGHLYAVKNKIKDVLIFGDFNGRNIIWGDTTTNKHGKKLMEFVDNTEFMLCTPADKTFVSPNGGSVIDLLLGYGNITKQISDNWTDREVELFTGAPIRGHFPVLYLIGGASQQFEPKEYDDYSNTDWKTWTKDLEENISKSMDQTVNELITDPIKYLDKLATAFDSAIVKASEKIPKKLVTRHSKPFWTYALTECSQELFDLNITLKTRLTPRNSQLFREKKEEFKQLLISEKNAWIREKLSNLNPSDNKDFWKRYRRLFNAQKPSFIGNLQKNGILYNSDSEKENVLFNEFFSGAHLEGSNFDAKFKDNINQCYNTLIDCKMEVSPEVDHIFTKTKSYLPTRQVIGSQSSEDSINAEITLEEIEQAIQDQKSGAKTTDGYEVNPIMLKYLGTRAKKVLIDIFNLSLETGSWYWKKQDVCFLKKPGKASYLDPGAYRPICISSYIGKLFEKILEKRLRYHCNLHDILDDTQEGFCPNRSTTRYLFKLLSNLEEAKKKKLTSMVLLLDFQKAFDSVWIPGLITKLYNYGVTGVFLRIINNFLCNRLIRLKVNGSYGEYRQLSALIGLPQGSILSPLLFIIYITEMLGNFHNRQHTSSSNLTTLTNAYKFADDGTVTVSGANETVCHDLLQKICNELHEWCMKWRLLINCDQNKTEVLIIHGGRENLGITLPLLKIGGKELQYVEKSKVLGIIVDDKLTFFQHGKEMLKRCWYQWHKITQGTTRHQGLNNASLILLFKSLVIPKLMYASPTWLHKQLDLFKDLWSRVLLKIIGSQYHTEKCITEAALNIPPLSTQLEVHSVKFLLKCLSSDDEMIAILLSIEQDSKHPFFPKIGQLKRFISWKQHDNIARGTVRTTELISYLNNSSSYYYNCQQIRAYQNKLWWRDIKAKFPYLNVDNWEESNGKYIFPQASIRLHNSMTAEFIHGHSLLFRNFQKTIRLINSDICEFCNLSDSNTHKLFECSYFDCEHRHEILNIIKNNIADFEWRIAVSSKNVDSRQLVHHFRSLVRFIIERSKSREIA